MEGRITLKFILKKWVGIKWSGFIRPIIVTVGQGNEPSGAIKIRVIS